VSKSRKSKSATPAVRRHLYFGYGSNLNPAQMARRCPDATLVHVAVLPDYRLSFRGLSGRWKGGVASVDPVDGARVLGAVYALSNSDLLALDRAEGHPAVYQRQWVTVEINGVDVAVQTYAKPVSAVSHVPSQAYTDAIADGYRSLGLDLADLSAAVDACTAEVAKRGHRVAKRYRKSKSKRGAPSTQLRLLDERAPAKRRAAKRRRDDIEYTLDFDGFDSPTYREDSYHSAKAETPRHVVFVYGSLLKGFGNYRHYLAGKDAAYVGRATTVDAAWGMLDLGSFPGVVPSKRGSPVKGEVYMVTDDVFKRLDRLEGHPRMYKREQVEVEVSTRSGDATTLYAWMYVYQYCDREAFALAVRDNDWRQWRVKEAK
jgi:gamma-glutamylcyclotransferase (GGCT)/AIG2-like uncharacterized protein YtfP